MSGHLERLVARHRDPPAVRLRAPSRYEGAHLSGPVEPSGAAAADGAPSPSPRERPSSRPARPSAPRVLQPDAAVTSEIDSVVEPPRPLSAVALRARDITVDARPTPGTDRAQAAPSGAGDPRGGDDSVRVGAAPQGPAPGTTVRPRITPRRQDVPATAMAGSVSPRRATLAAELEPNVVHVHIGRVEVRASTVAREPDRRRPAGPAGRAPLSLERYLEGERRR